ncbi:MAG TPA: thioesterase family protein [Patescibacteria group bacterium]|nr:thioesterase family protein [Patescibacteria group bacterium]
MKVTVRERVRFVETDLMGVVHHANYFRWFEVGRVEYLRQAGILLNDMMADGIVFPIRDVSCRYLASARFDDVLLIEATLAEVSKVKMVFTYRVLREADGVLLVTGQTQNVFTNPEGKMLRLPDCWYEKLVEGQKETLP